MAESSRILSRSSGPIDAPLMFVGEAPGRLGADASAIPFHGDKSGNNFESLLEFAGISRADVFVTNSVLCNPRDSRGRNVTPNESEISNCSSYLREQIDLVNPRIIVTLGATALRAIAAIDPHNLALKSNVRTTAAWYGRQLVPLYHPGQRAMIHRSFANQRSDYQFVGELLRRGNLGSRRRKSANTQPPSAVIREMVAIVMNVLGRVSYFGLHKLIYLIEYEYFKEKSARLSGAFFLRQKDGPYCTDLHVSKLKRSVPGLVVTTVGKKLYLESVSQLIPEETGTLSDEQRAFTEKTVLALSTYDDKKLKTRTYLSRPMREMLTREGKFGVNTYNAPIRFDF